MRIAKNIFLYIVFLFCVVLLFVGAPSTGTSRAANHIWDLGHIFLFALGSYILVSDVKIVARQSFFSQLFIIFVLSIVLGIATEYMQVKVNRTPDIADIGRDIVGSLLAVAFFSKSRKKAPTPMRFLIQLILLVLFIYQLIPFSRALADEIIARFQFPVLADFETPFERDRWTLHSRLQVTNDVAYHGKSSLMVKLNTNEYSSFFLQYFPRNWKNYRSLRVHFFNPDSADLELNCRIEDRWHKNFNGDFSDRFYLPFRLHQGWNTLEIPLDSLIQAPKTRKMDIENIELIGFYCRKLPRLRIVYIDDMRLI